MKWKKKKKMKKTKTEMIDIEMFVHSYFDDNGIPESVSDFTDMLLMYEKKIRTMPNYLACYIECKYKDYYLENVGLLP